MKSNLPSTENTADSLKKSPPEQKRSTQFEDNTDF